MNLVKCAKDTVGWEKFGSVLYLRAISLVLSFEISFSYAKSNNSQSRYPTLCEARQVFADNMFVRLVCKDKERFRGPAILLLSSCWLNLKIHRIETSVQCK